MLPQRRRLFVGCEGESEQGYVALLARLAEAARLGVHLDAVLLQPGGGDPLALVERAAAYAVQRSLRRGNYECRFVLLDRDKHGQTPERDSRIAAIAESARLHLIWQQPCHEALLLRHLEGCSQLRPPTTPIAIEQLRQRWAGYEKATPAARLADRLDRPALARAAQVEPDLAVLLTTIGLIP
ncbi:MAG TPA: RloB domain-containing protein [Sphingomonas sp.]